MRCIKTGCDAFLVEYGEWVHGDAFLSDSGDLLIRCAGRARQPSNIARHFTVNRIAHWFDNEKTSMTHNSTLFANSYHFVNHGYEGLPERVLDGGKPADAI